MWPFVCMCHHTAVLRDSWLPARSACNCLLTPDACRFCYFHTGLNAAADLPVANAALGSPVPGAVVSVANSNATGGWGFVPNNETHCYTQPEDRACNEAALDLQVRQWAGPANRCEFVCAVVCAVGIAGAPRYLDCDSITFKDTAWCLSKGDTLHALPLRCAPACMQYLFLHACCIAC